MRLKEPGMHLVGIVTLSLLITSINSFAFPKFKYYGKSFYELGLDTKAPSVTPKEGKKILRTILGRFHQETNGYDKIVKECEVGATCYRQKKLDYRFEVRPSVMAMIDSDKIDGHPDNSKQRIVRTPYCNKTYKVKKTDQGYKFPHHNSFNVEHTFPKSRFKKHRNYGLMVGDLHNLYPVHSDTNHLRSSYFFNNLADEDEISFCKSSKFGQIDGRFFFEPPTTHKGNVARAMMYFSLRYNLPLKKKELEILLDWHKVDKPDEKEKRRAQRIFKLQKNRNPFIDYPTLAEFLGSTLLSTSR